MAKCMSALVSALEADALVRDVMQDAKVVDHACTALSRIAESYARYPDRLNMLCNSGLINNAVQLVCPNNCSRLVDLYFSRTQSAVQS